MVPTGFAVPRFRVQGSGPEALPRFWVQKVACPRFRRFRCSMSSDWLGSVPKVWTEPALGTGFRESEVLRKFRVSEIPLPRFQKLLCTYFESMLLYFESKLLYFESMLLYFESMLLYFETILLYFESPFLYFESILLYFATMLASGCTENQYSKGKEKVVINVHFINANLRAVGDNTYAYFFSKFPGGLKRRWSVDCNYIAVIILIYDGKIWKNQCSV